MFTGLIEEVGKIVSVSHQRGTKRIIVSSGHAVRELKQGDSVSVNGVCLTALDVGPDSFAADLAGETVVRTSLARLAPGALVNLELPTKAGSRLGGHVVQGHVDGVGKLVALERAPGGEDWLLTVEIPRELETYVVEKGSIAIEGISLTVAKIETNRVSAVIIPHTFAVTNLRSLRPHDPVNIEVDVLSKYAEKLAQARDSKSAITLERLLSEGF